MVYFTYKNLQEGAMKKKIQLNEVPRATFEILTVYTANGEHHIYTMDECWLKAMARSTSGELYGAYWKTENEDEMVMLFECGLKDADLVVRYDDDGRAFDVTWGVQVWASAELEAKITGEDLEIDFDF